MNASDLPTAEPLIAGLTVADAMHRGIVTCPPSASIREVAELLSAHRVHCAVVAESSDGAVWGIVSALDLMRGLGSAVPLTAGNLAVFEPVTVDPRDDLSRAAHLMAEHDVAHLIVVADGSPVGILSTLDVADAAASGA